MLKHRTIAIAAALLLVVSAASAQVTLTGTVRDFVPGALVPGFSNPDFEGGCCGLIPGMVAAVLTGSAPTPTATAFSSGFVTSPASFAEWYGAAAPSVSHAITLTETFAGSGVYGYSSSSFFPIDGALLGNYPGWSHNYHFTYQISATFSYLPGTSQIFSFSGDDDVWVYFDKMLGIDLGGVHGAAGASVNLDALFGPGKAAGNYAFDFFFAERHTSESNFSIETSLALEPTSTVPEPASLVLLGTGLLGIGVVARRRRTA